MTDPKHLPDLTSVTLVAVTSVALNATITALRKTLQKAEFGDVVLLSDQRPSAPRPDIRHVEIERLSSRADYSRFMLHDLHRHVFTPHALCVQWDGYVLRGSAWDPSFLEYDYIGAVWPSFADGHDVGNGGFSLRSKKLLEACRELPFDGSRMEDVIICRDRRVQLEERGIRFAPSAVARQFSYERTRPEGNEFGFHGAFNLVNLVSPREAHRLFSSLEQEMLARSERWELLRWALRRGRLSLVIEMLRRLR